MKEFFENLKQIRLSKGISLEDISRKCRLSLKYLQEIENGNLEKLPQGYDRIFFKRYLKEIGEDRAEVWRDFNLFFGSGPLQKEVPYSSDIPPAEQPENLSEPDEPPVRLLVKKFAFLRQIAEKWNLDKIHRYFWIAVTVVILGVVGYFAYQQYVFVKNSPPEIKEISVSEYISRMQQKDSLLTRTIAQDTEIKSKEAGEVQLELRSVKRTWVREIRDQKDTTEYILSEGLVRKVSATESVRLMLGRADGVQVWLNGDSLGIMGKPNEVVVTLLLTPKGIIEKRLKAPTVRNEPETSQPLLQSQPSTEFELRPNRSNTPAGGD